MFFLSYCLSCLYCLYHSDWNIFRVAQRLETVTLSVCEGDGRFSFRMKCRLRQIRLTSRLFLATETASSQCGTSTRSFRLTRWAWLGTPGRGQTQDLSQHQQQDQKQQGNQDEEAFGSCSCVFHHLYSIGLITEAVKPEGKVRCMKAKPQKGQSFYVGHNKKKAKSRLSYLKEPVINRSFTHACFPTLPILESADDSRAGHGSFLHPFLTSKRLL